MSSQSYIEEIKTIWDMVKSSFYSTLSESTVNLWFGDIEILSFESTQSGEVPYILTLGTPSELKFKIVKEKYVSQIKNEFSRFLGFDIQVDLRFTGSAVSADRVASKVIGMKHGKGEEDISSDLESTVPSYNVEYTFENFIVGSTNKFAQAACVAVATKPAGNYNPLFIYGNSGLGKTHLMCATINRMKENNPKTKIIYTNGEDFTNQMISCLANKTMEDFRKKYRKCDVLLIDDIQFIAGKTAIQEEFFHTFNDLYERKKQIILTSDRPPRDIKPLEDRLISRFEWGLIADVTPPDVELRIAILKKKAEQVHVDIPDDVLIYLGENLRSNIRQIEGAIKKLGAKSFLGGQKITMELAHECVSELLGGAEPISVVVDRIFAAVQNKYNVSKAELTGARRNKEIALPRHISIYLIRELTDMSYPSIGKIFDRNHATIMNSYDTIAGRIFSDPVLSAEVNELRKGIEK